MTIREELLSLLLRDGYTHAPVDFKLSPHMMDVYHARTGSLLPLEVHFDFPWRDVADLPMSSASEVEYRSWYPYPLHPDVAFDCFGIAHEPGSAAAMHMTRMRHPLAGIESLDRMKAYPLPECDEGGQASQRQTVNAIHAQGLAAIGRMVCSIWETSWYLRSMEALMMDMSDEDPKAKWLLDRITGLSCQTAASFAYSGVDILSLGDDIGMQSRILMSEPLYREWLKPRLSRVIQTAKAIKPDLLVMYHSCGYIVPFIQDLIDAGVDILDPVQPESMDFQALHNRFGDSLSFHGTIGTQTTMPFGTPKDVRREVFRNLSIAGSKGGLICAPTHLIEPEVPWENVVAYVEACRDFVP